MNDLIVLTLNRGSSSLKFGLWRVGAGFSEALLTASISASETAQPFACIAKRLVDSGLPTPDAIGHRIVHGGPKLRQHCLIDDTALRQLDAASAFSPLHTPAALALIREAQEHFAGVPQMACFDTCFHAGLPDAARVLPIAAELQLEGLQRYGFHGLSCESIVHQLGDELPDRLLIAHLGNGSSITAVQRGRSIDTSMGLTPTGGVIMGTRSGDLDPGVLLYLMREKGFDAAMLEDLVNHRSGLLGISSVGSDLRSLHAAGRSHINAQLAIQMFCTSVRKQVAAMITVLDGVDLLVFTGGIGENDHEVRAAICSGLSWAGIRLDPLRNGTAENPPKETVIGPIHDPASRCAVQVLPSQEDERIAQHVAALTRHAADDDQQTAELG